MDYVPVVVVLMATHNGARYLKPQIESVLVQQGVSPVLVVGDDCSNDGTSELLISMKDDSDHLVLKHFKEPAGGAGQSFLRLLRETDLDNADFVAFCDQDDEWYPDKLSRATEALIRTGAVGYSSAVIAVWDDGRQKLLEQNPIQTDIDFLFEGAGQGCTFVLRGEFARQVQRWVREHRELLSGVHYHDWLVYALSRVVGGKWVFDSDPSMRYRQHENNDTGARGALAGGRKRLELIRNGWYANQVSLMIQVVSSISSGQATPTDFNAVWSESPSFARRMRLARILSMRGRRRFHDRVVLAISATLGWL